MDYGGFDTVKAEKKMAINKFKRKNKAKKFLRYVIVAASAVLLSWSSVWIPIFVQTTTLYIRFACTVVASQKFIFFMCNVIILTLAAKSGQLSGGGGSGSPDLLEEFMKNSENRQRYAINPEPVEEEVEKKCVSEDSPVFNTPEDENWTVEELQEVTKEVVVAEVASSKRGKYERSQSENLERAHQMPARNQLRRSETMSENFEGPMENGENSTQIVVEFNDDESNDEFTKRIEAFILKERSQREEETLRQKKKSLAVVVQSG